MVASNQSALLHPPPNFGSKRESSLESGYLSHEGSNSTPNSPAYCSKNLVRSGVMINVRQNSISEDDDGPNSPPIRFDIREKRKPFQT